jgi:hypothetical protein
MALIKEYGEMWARNSENIESIPGSKQGWQGAAIGIIKPK